MKKSLFLCLLLSFVSFLHAEELKFVTVLSSPVGSFNKLETVDDETPVTSPVINFCTSIGDNGTITLKGKNHPTMNALNLSNDTVLGREDTGSYVLKEITMRPGGTLKGSRLLANTVQVNYQTAGKSDNLYTESLTVAGAKAGKLYVNGKESYIESSSSDPGMVWSNEYQDDAACEGSCAKQYLLKQRGSGVPSDGKIVCTETNAAASACGYAFDANGNPSTTWGNLKLCSEVGGVTGGSFEGRCIVLKSCTLSAGVKGVLSQTGISHSMGQIPDECVNSSEYNDCGDFNEMYGAVYTSFKDENNADKTCEAFCTNDYLKEGRCTIKGASSSQANRCIIYGLKDGSCTKYTLTCSVTGNKPSQQAWIWECKRAS